MNDINFCDIPFIPIVKSTTGSEEALTLKGRIAINQIVVMDGKFLPPWSVECFDGLREIKKVDQEEGVYSIALERLKCPSEVAY